MLRKMDFSRTPDLPKFFVEDFFNDGQIFRTEWLNGGRDWEMELESVTALNEIAEYMGKRGGNRDLIIKEHKCEDFAFVCTFQRVAHFAVTALPIYWTLPDGRQMIKPDSLAAPFKHQKQFLYGEIMNSSLCRELSRQFEQPFFHLRFQVDTDGRVEHWHDIIFEKVIVRAKDWQKIYSYTGGKRVILSDGIYRDWKRE